MTAWLVGCAVCFGDPSAPMSKGADAGVAVLAAIILAVLAWVAFMIGFFVRRARKVAEARANAAARVQRGATDTTSGQIVPLGSISGR